MLKVTKYFEKRTRKYVMLSFSRSKCYCLLVQKVDTMELEDVSRAKGVDQIALQTLTYQDYYSALFHNAQIFKRFQRIRTNDYQLETITTNKLSL